jgi:tRNA U34 5-carboxymethylaminomethyl modifying enzyme MnmG/GidA
VAKKQNLQDWYDDYLEDEEIAQEVESLEEETQYNEYIANQEDEFARLLKEEVLPNSDVSK